MVHHYIQRTPLAHRTSAAARRYSKQLPLCALSCPRAGPRDSVSLSAWTRSADFFVATCPRCDADVKKCLIDNI